MCLLCGNVATLGGHGVAIADRPAHRLHGFFWEGSHAKAAAGGTREVLARAKAFSDARVALWKSPLVMLSWDVGPDGLRCFAAFAPEEDEAPAKGFSAIDVPAMSFASSWHGPQDGDVVAHYGRMLEWLRGSGWQHDPVFCNQREEYPHDADLEGPPALRLMLPVVKEPG